MLNLRSKVLAMAFLFASVPAFTTVGIAAAQTAKSAASTASPLDINTASRDQLTSLPGVTGGAADRVIAGRPYDSAGDLVTRHVMSKAEYDKIADQVTAKR